MLEVTCSYKGNASEATGNFPMRTETGSLSEHRHTLRRIKAFLTHVGSSPRVLLTPALGAFFIILVVSVVCL